MGSDHNRWPSGADPRPQPIRQQRLWQHSHRRTPARCLACSRSPSPCRVLMFCHGNTPSALNPLATAQANQTQQAVDPLLGGGTGPIEGRPPGAIWAHQRLLSSRRRSRMRRHKPAPRPTLVYNPQVPSSLNSGIDPATPIPLKFHPELANAERQLGMDFQRNHSAQAGDGHVRRTDPVPSSQRAAG